MKAKYKFQVIQDVVLLLILLSLMGFHLWGELIHEWLGIVFLLVLVLHNILNTHWYKKMFQREYSTFRMMQALTNILLLLVILSAIISGLMLSNHVLYQLPIHTTSDFVRLIHMTSVHWGQVIIGAHLGMHWRMLAGFFCKVWKISVTSIWTKWIFPLVFLGIALYGLVAFISRELLPYLLIQVNFAFFDFTESKWLFYFDFLAITVWFAYMMRFFVWVCIRRK